MVELVFEWSGVRLMREGSMVIFIGVLVVGLLGVGAWLLTKIIYNRWFTAVTIPRIARRECARLDQEYEELVRSSRRPPQH